MTEGTWNTRDLAMLRAVVDTYEGWGRYLTRATAIERRTGLDHDTPSDGSIRNVVFREGGQNIGRADNGGSAGGGLSHGDCWRGSGSCWSTQITVQLGSPGAGDWDGHIGW
jgi:hypothetical protein